MSRFFLNIEPKEDTPKKLAEAQGKPRKHFLFATEFNAIVSRIISLYSYYLLLDEKINGTTNDTPSIDLGDISGFGMLFWEWMNTSEAIDLIAPVYIIYNDGAKKYVYSFIGVDGNYGANSNQLIAADFIKLEESFLNDVIPLEKVISLNLTQNGNTVANIINKNTTGMTPNFVRNQTGVFVWQFPVGAQINPSKVELLIGSPILVNPNYNIKAMVTNSEVTVTTNNGNIPSDDVLNNTSIRLTFFS